MNEFPAKVGKFEILGLLGQGSMGTVYLAHDPYRNHKVAIKVCKLDNSDRIGHKLFFNEARSAGSLHHPGILGVLDAGDDSEGPYLVLEYIANAKPLTGHCRADGLLPLPQVVAILFRLAKALDYAHRHGVIHRDIKPANILLTQELTPKICDFGVARRTQSDTTQILGVFGSPRYMAPEQALDAPIGPQTDLYSLGVVMFELLTGQAPFIAAGFSQLLKKLMHETPPCLHQIRPELPPSLDCIMQRALQKSPQDRYPSGKAMAADLALVYRDLNLGEERPSRKEIGRQVRQLSFFEQFYEQEISEIVDACIWEKYAPEEQIITEGNLDQAFFIILSGEVSVLKESKLISTLGKGDCFGEMGYLAKARRTATIVSHTEVCLIKIDSTLMEKTSADCQLHFSHVFLQTLIERLARTSEQLAQKAH